MLDLTLSLNPTEASAPMIEQTEQHTKNINMIRNIQVQFPNYFKFSKLYKNTLLQRILGSMAHYVGKRPTTTKI